VARRDSEGAGSCSSTQAASTAGFIDDADRPYRPGASSKRASGGPCRPRRAPPVVAERLGRGTHEPRVGRVDLEGNIGLPSGWLVAIDSHVFPPGVERHAAPLGGPALSPCGIAQLWYDGVERDYRGASVSPRVRPTAILRARQCNSCGGQTAMRCRDPTVISPWTWGGNSDILERRQ